MLKEDNSGHRKEFPVTEENCSWKKEISLRSNIPVTERSLLLQQYNHVDRNKFPLTGTTRITASYKPIVVRTGKKYLGWTFS